MRFCIFSCMKNIFRSLIQPWAAIPCIALGLCCIPAHHLAAQTSPQRGNKIAVKHVNSISIDHDDTKWFSTDVGIVSFDGIDWKLHKDVTGMPDKDLKGITYANHPEGPELWIASSMGATITRLPMGEQAETHTFNPENAPLPSQDILGIAAGEDNIRWIGTDKGIWALSHDKWLNPDYDGFYTERMFMEYPITSMATNARGDSLYAGTEGVGIFRVYRNDVDGISGASVYAQWGPIDLPSDYILSIYIAADGTKWFGTEEGIARHTGNNTLDGWTAFYVEDGLVDNFVQAICGDKHGNIWVGTPSGISVFDGSSWTSYNTENGLISNNILSLAADRNGLVWIGTDAGICSYEKGKFISY